MSQIKKMIGFNIDLFEKSPIKQSSQTKNSDRRRPPEQTFILFIFKKENLDGNIFRTEEVRHLELMLLEMCIQLMRYEITPRVNKGCGTSSVVECL